MVQINNVGFIQNCWYLTKLWLNKACLPIFGHTFLAITLLFVCQSGWQLLRELRRLLSIDWRWKFKLWCLIFIFESLGHFWRENGCAYQLPCAPLMVWGLRTLPKSCHTGWTFKANCYLEIMLSKFLGLNPFPAPPPLREFRP